MGEYKKRVLPEEPFEEPEEKPIEEGDDLFYSPTSPIISALNDVLTAGKDLPGLQSRKKAAHSSTAFSVLQRKRGNPNERVVKAKSQSSELYIYVADIEKIAGNNKQIKNFLAFTLIKANQQVLNNGELTGDTVAYSLQELVDIGMYSDKDSARVGFNSAMDILTSAKVRGHIKKGKREITEDKLRVLFTGSDSNDGDGICVVYLNPHVNWSFVAAYFTVYPSYYFRLKSTAHDLLSYIFDLARQNIKKIAEQGYFTIKLRTIWSHLGLPSEKGNGNPGKTIRKPIEDAIEQIEDAQLEYYNNGDLKFELVNNDVKYIKDYLDNGYLKIYISGHFAEMFISIYESEKKKIETAQKRTEGIEDKARAIALSKALSDDKEGGDEDRTPPVEKN